MKKNSLGLILGLVIGLAGAVASADEVCPPSSEANECELKTDLSADMVAKCTEAMAKGDKAMLEGCCQGAAPESHPSSKS